MEDKTSLEFNFAVWLLIADLQHKMVLVREKELSRHNITPRQLHVLRLIDSLGPNARLSAITKALDRKLDVITKQAVLMENNGLIKRILAKPKSRLFRIELTPKGRELLDIDRYSHAMNEVLSILTKDELLQFHLVLNRLLIKLKQYDPENASKKIF